MPNSNFLKKLALLSPIILLSGLGHGVLAHSIILIEGNGNFVLENTQAKAVYRIVHACTESSLPVIAQSLLVPTIDPIIKRLDGGQIDDTDADGIIGINDVIEGFGLTGHIHALIDTSVFKQRQIKTDSLGNPISFSSTEGKIPDKFNAEIPFLITSVSFIPNSCISQLVVHPVGADICKISNPPQLGDANIWMEHVTSEFPNPVHGVGENSLQIIFKRNLKTNPLPTDKSCGNGYAVHVYASDQDINKNLLIKVARKLYWPK